MSTPFGIEILMPSWSVGAQRVSWGMSEKEAKSACLLRDVGQALLLAADSIP
jgi:hypothetical protein